MTALAQGGMGEVFLGVLQGAEGISTPVVIKRIRPEYAQEAAFRSMFRDEARALSFVRHPNVVQVFEFGAEKDELFLVMEYIEGESATTLLRTVRKTGHGLPLAVAVQIVAQAAAGLHAAHEQRNDAGEHLNLVHRDVSPQNILVTYGGMAKIIDFGIAKTEQQDTLTRTGELKGKYGYMSPEQFMEKPLDRRVDIFALGVVLFELVTARRLFKRQSAHAAMRAICDEPLPEPTLPSGGEVPPWLAKVLAKALARAPEDRYATAQEFRRDLRLGLRELDPESRVEEELPKLMLEHFSERRATKRQLMMAVKAGTMSDVESAAEYVVPTPSGTSLSAVPGSAAQSIAQPALASQGGAPLQPPETPRRGGRLLMVAMLFVAALVGAAGGWFGWFAPVDAEVDVIPLEPVGEGTATGPAALVDASVIDVPVIDAAEELDVGEDLTEAPIAASLHVETRPPGAVVYIDGERQGRTPFDLELEEPGSVTLTFRRSGYLPLEEVIDVSGQVRANFVLQRRRRVTMMNVSMMETEGEFGRFD